MIYIYVGIAGVLGALCRYAAGLAANHLAAALWLPVATLLCNYSGSFALGWLSSGGAARMRLSDTGRIAVTSGFVGSYTTFSSFSAETVHLLQSGEIVAALSYVMISLWGGLLLAWLGIKIGERKAAEGGVV
ncbi:fluoride efflux transporter CrcB [Paenibacillus hemerocallicola]|uniref:Fluoride-specific ion channel FluC n=1 Tax=Paenibacillus hemerocallicola TaxID=1172614 RepID=A0A5C4TDZ7_9BACL|nr:fluoride efflux transporter CrcB [Paenibacillus hemerocallicola]TNJ67145.1 fluoride efflux transporter CrcB [Paenibacillus hemerocallicola]